VLFMLEVLKKIKEKQQEANKIIDDASIEAEKIKQGVLQKAIAANEEVYLAEIAQAEKRAADHEKAVNYVLDMIFNRSEKK